MERRAPGVGAGSPARAHAARRARGVRAGLRAVLIAAAGLALAASPAAADRTFAPRFSTTDHGQVLTAANTVMTCSSSASGCAAARAGTSTTDNGDFAM